MKKHEKLLLFLKPLQNGTQPFVIEVDRFFN